MNTLPPVTPSPFPPGARVRVSAEFQAVFTAGRRLSSSHLRLFAWLRAEAPVPRLGIAVSKKVDKRAVGRNRIKRIAKEAYRLQKNTLLNEVTLRKNKLAVFFIYTDKNLPAFEAVKDKMRIALQKLITIIHEMYTPGT